ncbi:hypothetical protein TRVL_08652 [Trypanosoma vivax]|nr:hypothetical protein TRVL_08652 [Trypanosoma vivax]
MAFRFNLALLAAILLNATVLGDDSAFSGALVGADGERNAPSREGDAGCKSEGRARNGDKLVVLDSARTTPSETVRKSVSVARRMSGQSSLSSRNEARNDHVGVGNEPHDHPVTNHKAQTSVDDKHGMILPHAKRPATSRHSEGGLTSKSPKKSAEALDRKKEFESMVSGIIAEEADTDKVDSPYSTGVPDSYNYGTGYYDSTSSGSRDQVTGSPPVAGSSMQSNLTVSQPASPAIVSSNNGSNNQSVGPSSSVTSAAAGDGQSSREARGDKDNTNNGKTLKAVQEEEDEEMKEKKQDEEEKGEKQLDDQSRSENNDGQETNNSSEETENEETPSMGNSAFLCGSYSSVLLVALMCLCACVC